MQRIRVSADCPRVAAASNAFFGQRNLLFSSLFAALLVAGFLVGCTPTTGNSSAEQVADGETVSPAVSTVPLRVWIAAPVSNQQLFTRQWLSDSEQPLAIEAMSVDELLEQTSCECDVLIYPSRLVGELVKRDWIMKLPAGVADPRGLRDNTSQNGPGGESDSDAPNGSLRACERNQAAYAGRDLAVPLGCAIPTFVASSSLADQLQQDDVSWNRLLEILPTADDGVPLEFEDSQVDRDALVDRFLAIAATVCTRDPGYGLLFDMQSMQSRLKEPEFVRAASILTALAAQRNGAEAILGDHSAAWTWSAENEQSALAIASVALIDNEAIAAKSGKILRVSAQTGSVAGGSQDSRGALTAWNPGVE